MTRKLSLGIDLGTSNSCLSLCAVDGGPAQTVPVTQVLAPAVIGEKPLLASVLYLPAPGEYADGSFILPWNDADARGSIVGSFARERGATVPDRVVSSAKSWLCNPDVDRRAPILPWQSDLGDAKISPFEATRRYLAHLREINRATEVIEDKLQKSTRNRELLELLKYQKSLTFFATALRSNELMMERVQRTQIFNYYEEDQDLLEDVLTENQQAIQMTNINTEILSRMTDAFASIISNNINSVMKVLAALTIIINLPLLVTSFYGMNVNLPGAEREHAFIIVVGLSVALTAILIYIFYKRDWL